MAITFQSQEIDPVAIGFKLPRGLKIKSWIKTIVESEKKKLGQLNFVFTNDEVVLNTNIRFLKHNTYTDIITFDYCEKDVVHGDIIISVERVKENAAKFKVEFNEELKRVIIHGVLHLCGYKDKITKDAELMRKKENSALRKYKGI